VKERWFSEGGRRIAPTGIKVKGQHFTNRSSTASAAAAFSSILLSELSSLAGTVWRLSGRALDHQKAGRHSAKQPNWQQLTVLPSLSIAKDNQSGVVPVVADLSLSHSVCIILSNLAEEPAISARKKAKCPLLLAVSRPELQGNTEFCAAILNLQRPGND
jgi:hypothetical protein